MVSIHSTVKGLSPLRQQTASRTAITEKNNDSHQKSQSHLGRIRQGQKSLLCDRKTVAAGSSAQAFNNNATSKELFTVALYIDSIQTPEAELKSKPGIVQL